MTTRYPETADELRQVLAYYGEEALDLYDIRIMECDGCDGAGWIEGHVYGVDRTTGAPMSDTYRCRTCDGSGLMEIETQPVECDEPSDS